MTTIYIDVFQWVDLPESGKMAAVNLFLESQSIEPFAKGSKEHYIQEASKSGYWFSMHGQTFLRNDSDIVTEGKSKKKKLTLYKFSELTTELQKQIIEATIESIEIIKSPLTEMFKSAPYETIHYILQNGANLYTIDGFSYQKDGTPAGM